MSVHYFNKDATNSGTIAAAAGGTLAGPLNIGALESLGFTVFACSTAIVSIHPRVSVDKDRDYEAEFPLGALQNTGAITVGASEGESVVRTMMAPNTFTWLSFNVSCTAALTSGSVKLFVHGKIRG